MGVVLTKDDGLGREGWTNGTVMVSEGKTLASDGMEVCSGKDGVDWCAGGLGLREG